MGSHNLSKVRRVYMKEENLLWKVSEPEQNEEAAQEGMGEYISFLMLP